METGEGPGALVETQLSESDRGPDWPPAQRAKDGGWCVSLTGSDELLFHIGDFKGLFDEAAERRYALPVHQRNCGSSGPLAAAHSAPCICIFPSRYPSTLSAGW